MKREVVFGPIFLKIILLTDLQDIMMFATGLLWSQYGSYCLDFLAFLK